MDSSSDRHHQDFSNRTRHSTKLPNIHKQVKILNPVSSRSVSAATTSSVSWGHEKLPQIDKFKNGSHTIGMGMCVNNNAKTRSSDRKQNSNANSREKPTSSKANKRERSVAASSSDHSDSTDSISQPGSMSTQGHLDVLTFSPELTQSGISGYIVEPSPGLNNKTEVSVKTDSSGESQSAETPSRSRKVSISNSKNELNPLMDLLQPNNGTDSPRSREVSIIDNENIFNPSTHSSEEDQNKEPPTSRHVSINDEAMVFYPSPHSSEQDLSTEQARSRLLSTVYKGSALSHTTDSSEDALWKLQLPPIREQQSNVSLSDTPLMDDSLESMKRLRFKKRSTMTLLSPTPADIEDAITRHGLYEGDIPVIKPEKTVDEGRQNTPSVKMSLLAIMSIIDQISHEEIGFDVDQLVRTDPTVAKAVCEVLRVYTREDPQDLKIIALALCDDKLSNQEVIRLIAENVKRRVEDNKTIYSAIYLFVSKTQDPTKMQWSNSALSEENSPSSSQTFIRSERSVSFLMKAMDKYMRLSKRAASLMSNEWISDSSFTQRRESFQAFAGASKASLADRGGIRGGRSSFDFETPSGWFFKEVDIDYKMVETILKSMPSLMALLNRKMGKFEDVDIWSDEERQSNEEKTKRLSRHKLSGTRQSSSSMSPKLPQRVTFEKVIKAEAADKTPAKLETWQDLQEQTAKATDNRRTTNKKARQKKFTGWDSTQDLPPHWLKRLPKEKDLIVPVLQNIRRHQLKDKIKSTKTGSRKPRSTKQPSGSRKYQSKIRTPSVSRGEKTTSEVVPILDPEDLAARLDQDLEAEDTRMASELQEDESVSVSEAAATDFILPRTRSQLPGQPPCSVEGNPKETAYSYLCKHDILELFADLISHLVLTTPSNPLDTLINRVHQMNYHQGVKKPFSSNPVP